MRAVTRTKVEVEIKLGILDSGHIARRSAASGLASVTT